MLADWSKTHPTENIERRGNVMKIATKIRSFVKLIYCNNFSFPIFLSLSVSPSYLSPPPSLSLTSPCPSLLLFLYISILST